MKLTKEQRISRHKDFMSANWELIAGFAWGRHLRDGRGIVVVMEEDFVHAAVPELKGLRFEYAAEGGDLIRKISTSFEEKEWRWLKDYDPDKRVIVVVVREDGGTSGYLIGGGTKPSETYAKQKAQRN